MKIRIKNLRLKTIIGVNDLERETKQDIVIRIEIECDGKEAAATDDIRETVNYRTLTKRIIQEVEESRFYLLERLAHHILQVVLEDKKVARATVEVDKPQALRYADSVSVRCSSEDQR